MARKTWIMVAALASLAACGALSPKSRFMAACTNDKAACECMAGKLDESLSSSEFGSLVDELEALKEAEGSGNEQALGMAILGKMMGAGESAKGWQAFVASAKACSAG